MSQKSRLWLLALLALALTVRLLGLFSRPIWYDEAFSLLFAPQGPQAMLQGTLAQSGAAAEEHPLGYYLLLWGWLHLTGVSVWSGRLLSIAASLGSLWIAFRLGQRLFGERSALTATLLLALSPFQVHYAQEIRMYAWLNLWLMAAALAYWRAQESQRLRHWLEFALFCALAQYTHTLAAFFLLPLAAWPLLRRQGDTARAVLAAGLGAVLLYLPWLLHLPEQFAKVNQAYWVEKPGPEKLFSLILYYFPHLPLPAAWLGPGLFAGLSVLALAGLQTWRTPRKPEGALWAFYLAFVPAGLLFGVSQWKPVYIERALLPSASIFFLWLAWTLTETRLPQMLRRLALTLTLVAFGLGLWQHLTYAGFPYAPYAALGQTLSQRIQPGDVIVHSSKLSLLPLRLLAPSLPQVFVQDPPGSSVDTLAPVTQRVLGVTSAASPQAASAGAERVWVLIFAQSEQEALSAGQSQHPHLAWMRSAYREISHQTWGDLNLYLFAP